MVPRVLEGRHNVAHGACPKRREGEAVGNKVDYQKEAPAGAALSGHATKVAQYASAPVERSTAPLESPDFAKSGRAVYFAGVVSFFSMSRKLS